MFTCKSNVVLYLSKNFINYYKIVETSSTNFLRRKNSTQSGIDNFNLEDEISNMRKIYPSVKEELLKNIPSYVDESKCENFIDYNFNILHKQYLFATTIFLYRNLSPAISKNFPTREEQYTLGILNELWHSLIFITDDIIDNSELRVNYPTWHTFNDEYELIHYYIPALYSSVSSFTAKNFEKRPYYKNLSALYHKNSYKVCISLVIDYISTKLQKNMNWMEFYHQLLYFKTAYYFETAIKSILYSIGYEKIPYEKEYDKILVKIGFYLQLVNDYDDHFEQFAKTGKSLNDDIKAGTVSWPMVYAWKYGSEKQKKLIAENYGQKNEENIAVVSGIYENLNIREKLKEFEKECQSEIKNGLKIIPDKNMQILALKVIDVIKGRAKF